MARRSAVYQVLVDRETLLGGSKKAVGANLVVCFGLVIGLHTFWLIGGSLLLHLLIVYFTHVDPDWWPVYWKYSRQRDHYEPWVMPSTARATRPAGFGKNLPC